MYNFECGYNSGDQDSVIPLTGSRTLVHQLAGKLGLNTTVPYRVWFAGEQVLKKTRIHFLYYPRSEILATDSDMFRGEMSVYQ